MKQLRFGKTGVLLVSLLLLLMPATVSADTGQESSGPAPIEQQLVREGDFAVKLLFALGVGSTEDEVEAESKLSEVGITPRNGWIADYPVTPDIIGELQAAVGEAADARKIAMGRDEALQRFDTVAKEMDLLIKPHTVTKTYEALPEDAKNYPNPAVINNYYYDEGPPVVTYYAPPPDYYYLYSWVPYPFWWTGFWFPGFFVLHDFHRPFVVNKRVVFVSNHFNDIRSHRVFRVDSVARFRGRTFAGIGVQHRREFINTGVPHSDRRIFNGPRAQQAPGVRSFATQSRGGGGRAIIQSTGGRTFNAPSRGSSRSFSAPSNVGVRSFSGSPRGGSMSVSPSRGGGMSVSPSRGGGGGGGGGGSSGRSRGR